MGHLLQGRNFIACGWENDGSLNECFQENLSSMMKESETGSVLPSSHGTISVSGVLDM